MALFTDGPVSGMEDLTAQDTQLSNVASVEGIDVTQKLVLAQEELALEITTLLSGSRRAEQAFWLAAQPTDRQRGGDTGAEALAHIPALEMVYGDAYSSQLNDRYAAKRDQFHERANWAYERLSAARDRDRLVPIPRAGEPQVVSAAGSLGQWNLLCVDDLDSMRRMRKAHHPWRHHYNHSEHVPGDTGDGAGVRYRLERICRQRSRGVVTAERIADCARTDMAAAEHDCDGR
jgi:hypothetical protein